MLNKWAEVEIEDFSHIEKQLKELGKDYESISRDEHGEIVVRMSLPKNPVLHATIKFDMDIE